MKSKTAGKLYKIETGIKLPTIAVSHKATMPSRAALTMATLEKGESFLIKDELDALKATKVMRDFNTRERERKTGREFVQRKVGKGIRMWRVK